MRLHRICPFVIRCVQFVLVVGLMCRFLLRWLFLRAANCIWVDAAGTAPKARRSNLAVLRLGLGHESLMRISFGKVPSELGE